MNIMMISDHASPLARLGGTDSGGQNVYVDCLSRMLAERGLNIDIVTRREDDQQPDVVTLTQRVRVIHVAAGPRRPIPKESLLPHMPEFAARCGSLAKTTPYDIVHANFFMSGLVACELKQALALPFAVTFHALGKVRRLHQAHADGFPDERFAIEERIVREADAIIAECPQDRDDLETFYRADPSRIATVPCGVEEDVFSPESKAVARRKLGLPADREVMLQLGRIVPRKGIDNVIQAMAMLSEVYPKLTLMIVGGETDHPDADRCPEMGRLMTLAAELNVRERVMFAGRRPAKMLRWYYSAADMFITTPWYEPFGITPLEAMACGTPVIGSRVGGLKHSIKHGETGLLVPPKNPRALADAIHFLLARPHVMERFSMSGKERVQQHFTWRHVAARMHAVYQQIPRGLRRTALSETAGTRRQTAGRVLFLPPPAARRDYSAPLPGEGKIRSRQWPRRRRVNRAGRLL